MSKTALHKPFIQPILAIALSYHQFKEFRIQQSLMNIKGQFYGVGVY